MSSEVASDRDELAGLVFRDIWDMPHRILENRAQLYICTRDHDSDRRDGVCLDVQEVMAPTVDREKLSIPDLGREQSLYYICYLCLEFRESRYVDLDSRHQLHFRLFYPRETILCEN
jgi:hypothetical protein